MRPPSNIPVGILAVIKKITRKNSRRNAHGDSREWGRCLRLQIAVTLANWSTQQTLQVGRHYQT